ncbi:mitochondrial mRNA pseudouridine synthase Trub2 [Sitophilus oryzae]|uniref:Mitochondrial mRNA pseudouridine synthase Trub2 n=1 Tax=Sitophilus oryzae TaxID=7048 RepID=A0A6J2Y0J2_SITOR|nr:mitochondrial mRNA pseudouridine synthase Trub2 [Sitophilus oryzae]
MVTEAPLIWNNLRGIVCIFKPAEYSVKRLRSALIHKLCQDMNKLEVRPPIDYVAIEGNPSNKLSVSIKPNLADHPLVVGPRYQEQDFVISWSNFLGWNTSGVLLFGLKSGTKQAKYIRENKSARAYRVKGILGQATDNCYRTGKVIEKSTWKHVKRGHMEKFLSAMQASHQKKMFELCGVDMQSETAYELAVKGLLRPANSKIPVIYGIKCVEFQPPNFTLEIHCINEYETYLMHLVHEIGTKLHSTAHCTALQCIRHGGFTLQHALLMKHWDLANILDNIAICDQILRDTNSNIPQQNATLV